MRKSDIFRIFEIEDMRDLPNKTQDVLFGDKEQRNNIYTQLLKSCNRDLSQDWFQEFYESELSERKQKGQDFSSDAVGVLCARLTRLPKGFIHEPTAGTGSLLISYWWEQCMREFPWRFRPSTCIISCWELSSRSIPILLLNLSIRGIMGEVFHGDVLEQKVKARYVLLNECDDPLAFSDIIRDDSIQRYNHSKFPNIIAPSLFDNNF